MKGALLAALFWECVAAAQATWKCRHCGFDQTSIINEICDGCGVEDCEQGTDDKDSGTAIHHEDRAD